HEVSLRRHQRFDPVGAELLRGVLLELEHTVQHLLVRLQPYEAVLFAQCEHSITSLSNALRCRLDIRGEVRRLSHWVLLGCFLCRYNSFDGSPRELHMSRGHA